ncbi:MAG TPA: S8 family serine peptidase, partial [Rudaea sp.]|nr:S8 family serine peptidase [Rudaea sp.]
MTDLRKYRLRSLSAAMAMLGFGSLGVALAAGDDMVAIDAPTFPSHAIVANALSNTAPRYIVRFGEAPLAQYNSLAPAQQVNGLSSIPTRKYKNGRVRLDVHSVQAQQYVNYIVQKQQQHVSDIATAIGHVPRVLHTMQYALNAAVMDLSADEALKVKRLPGVISVTRDVYHPLATDIGPGFIGASSVWWGASAGQDTIFANGFDGNGNFLGDGIVIGDIDTGYNSLSPSFSATDAHGYTIQNPLGSGNYLGQCAVANISLGGCNDKVIGVYDEIKLTSTGAPFSVEDTQGHGSHTASTAAGSFRSATVAGYTANIAGVAPHANLVIYYACSDEGCPDSATAASVDQAIQDGIVDALNYSISGGTDPWNEATSQAFMSAADAGIFVAAAAGNTSASVPVPLPGTANHFEPWVTTVAAGTHTGGGLGFLLNVNGTGAPGPVPLLPAASGTGLSAPASNVPIVPSPNYDSGNDGCSSFTGTPFTGSIALLKYSGACGTNAMASRAIAAGADYVIIVYISDVGFLSAANQLKPVWTTQHTVGDSLKAYALAHPGTTGNLIYPLTRLPTQPDRLASFSLLGPDEIDLIKPDVQAPGVGILAAVANDGSGNGPNLVDFYDGTSMATPHTTGSGALMIQAHPGWTPAEIKSALMMTAKEAGLTKADGSTPSDYFDRGSGRLQDFVAIKSGLVMNETGLNYANANPATGGDPDSLNLPSMQSSSCITVTSPTTSTPTCSFTRKFRSTKDHSVTWTPSISGVNATTSLANLVVAAHANSQPITVTVDASSYNADGVFHFGELVLTPNDPLLTPLHLPIAVRVPAPSIAVQP